MRSAPLIAQLVSLAACGRLGFDPGAGQEASDGPQVVATAPTAGLIGYWAFEEGAGTVSADLSGNGRAAELSNMEADDWTPGVRGGALHLDRIAGDDDDFVRYGCAGTSCPVEVYTISLWFRADRLEGTLFSYFGGERFDSPGQKSIVFSGQFLHVGRSSVRRGIDRARLSPARWHHVAVSYGQGPAAGEPIIHAYLDGVDVTVVSDDYWNSGAFSLGRRVDDYSALPYGGAVDEVRLYDRVLTAAEVAGLHAYDRP